MTFGSTEVSTASRTDLFEPRVAMSIAQARFQSSERPAFWAAMRACTVCTMFPPAR